MDSVQVTFTAQQPISVAIRNEVAYFQHGADHLPGSAVRGALAGAWIVERKTTPQNAELEVKNEFLELFEGEIHYGEANVEGLIRTPMSALVCKFQPTESCAHHGIDLAYEDDRGSRCGECKGETEAGKGQIRAPYIRRTRTAIDRKTGSSLEKGLYSQELLETTTRFTAQIRHVEKLPPKLQEWLLQDRIVRIGSQRSVMGRASYSALPTRGTEKPSATLRRADGKRVIRLQSNAILLDDMGRPTLDLGVELERRNIRAKIHNRWVRPIKITGWNVAAGLPKPEEWAIAAGSTFLLSVEEGQEDALMDLALQGIGHRRREGFGAIVIDPEKWRPSKQADDQTASEIHRPLGPEYAHLLDAIFRYTGDERQTRRQLLDLLHNLDPNPGKRITTDIVSARAFWKKTSASTVNALDQLLVFLDERSPSATEYRELAKQMTDWLNISGQVAGS